jgi:iduronate 2-sulfatase
VTLKSTAALPFVAPKKYADLYPLSSIRLAPFQQRPAGAPEYAPQDSMELKNGSFTGFANLQGALPAERQKELIRGYMACVSYMDAQFGKVLDAVEKSGEAKNIIVVLWGDHGWHLGDHGMWCKHTNYQQATRAPLIIARRAKGGTAAKTSAPVEFVDIYPTLCELAGIPSPETLHGKSLVPALEDPKAIIKDFAVSQYPRGQRMGYAFRDRRYRYVRWVRKDAPDELQAEEIYDYEADPLETRNLLREPAASDALKRLRQCATIFLEGSPASR